MGRGYPRFSFASGRLLGLLAASLALLAAGPAGAGPLASAQLGIEIGALPAVSFPATGATGQTSGDQAATLDAGTAFAGTVITSATDPAAVPITGIYVYMDSNDAGSFTGSPLGGAAEFRGTYDIQGFGMILLSVPLRFGGAVTETRSQYGLNLTAISSTWTAGTASVWLPGATAPEVRAGSDELTPGGAGRLLLVSPLTLLTNLSGGTNFAGFGFLELTYVPEPRALALIAGGIALLAAGRARRG